MLSGANTFEISDFQEVEIEICYVRASVARVSQGLQGVATDFS
jgi:hypothetical protein